MKPTVPFLEEGQVHETSLAGKEMLDVLLAGELEVLRIVGKVESPIRLVHGLMWSFFFTGLHLWMRAAYVFG